MKMFVGLDNYGETLGVNYAGKSSYQTKLGALLSILSSILVLYYAGTRILQLVNKTEPEKSSQIQYINLIGSEGLDLHEGDFGLAITVYDGRALLDNDKTNDLDYVAETIPPQVGHFELVENLLTFDKGWHYKTVPDGLEKCSLEKHFKYYVKNEVSKTTENYIEDSLCLNTENLKVKGTIAGGESSNLAILLRKCDPDERTDCLSEEEHNNYMATKL